MRLIKHNSSERLYPSRIIRLAMQVCVYIACLFVGGCTNPDHSPDVWRSRISQNTPLGSNKAHIAAYLRANSLTLTDNIARPLPEGERNDKVYKRASATIETPDSWISRNSKLILDFYFDDDDKLVYFTVQETYSSL